ncbi:hypothetical protein MPTK1_6g14820 [Marchantia polymorpha subsp. ruderalis]|uniref:Uncharacterized protein n=2 Tax=Marchantia polymorpha TaxID=3197 RepID=A0AAF6BS44_MARPO|nr:hypothetical protein MARPO_0047s0137 [Marchantia polymorpha]BBN14828.1 hypothetical protein Mp_6g14820 [Marchantia polymorpha subsp. ruderalis]|eukprot:PTQ39173.1 hypothetical protein MARPO_0047s0137 [Marchantia polymorpha]
MALSLCRGACLVGKVGVAESADSKLWRRYGAGDRLMTSAALRTTLLRSVLARSCQRSGASHCALSARDLHNRSGRRHLTKASASDVRTSETVTGQAAMGEIVPAVIVGAGRVGSALEKMGGGNDVLVKRGEPIPADGQGPIIICTRNDSLAGIIDATPASRREDLVFIQNGMLEPFLESKGLASATQVLVYFAVAKAGDAPIDGKTDMNPEGLTASTGKWASAVAARLESAGLSCKVLDAEEFKKPQLEKLIWISAFMLVGTRHPGATCGDVESKYREEVVSLIQELAAVAESVKNTKFDSGIEERLCAYARSVSHYPTAVKEFEWRNGWFYDISQRALSNGETDPCPLHTAWLKEVGVVKS